MLNRTVKLSLKIVLLLLIALPVQAGLWSFTGQMGGGIGFGATGGPGAVPIPIAGVPIASATSPGYATVTGSGPANFTLPAGQFSAMTTYTRISPTPPIQSSMWYGSFGQGAGSFFAGGGPGNGTVTIPGEPGKLVVTEDPTGNQFGGTMGWLGFINIYNEILSGGGSWVGIAPFPISPWGLATGATTTSMQDFYHTTLLTTYPVTGQITAGPRWTTGMIFGTDMAGLLSSTVSTTGYDNRTPGGMGTIQMVSGAFWHFDGFLIDDGLTTMQTTVTFAPEPTGFALLVSGMLLLPILDRARRRRR